VKLLIVVINYIITLIGCVYTHNALVKLYLHCESKQVRRNVSMLIIWSTPQLTNVYSCQWHAGQF